MSDDSLFSKHWRLIDQDQAKWSIEVRKEFERLQGYHLPELELKPSWRARFRTQIQLGLGAVVMASLALILLPTRRGDLSAKGSMQVSVYFEREAKVSTFKSETVLKDGDKIGASINSAEEAFAYWAITDSKLNVISAIEDIESSRIFLEPGVAKSFATSFVLVAPNQGEHLVVVVCPKKDSKPDDKAKSEDKSAKTEDKVDLKKPIDALFNQDFISRLLTEQKILSSNCVFVGYRLRSLP